MKGIHKIIILFFCLVLALPWAGTRVLSFVLKAKTEKTVQISKDGLAENDSDAEEFFFELVSVSSPFFSAYCLVLTNGKSVFSEDLDLPKSVYLELSYPPPEALAGIA